MDRLTSLTHGDDEQVTRFTYSETGQLIAREQPNGWRTTYTHDAAGQLVRQHADSPSRRSRDAIEHRFTYDPAGNVIREYRSAGGGQRYDLTHTYDEMNRLIRTEGGHGFATHTYEYDSLGNLVTESQGRNHHVRYWHNNRNQLVQRRENGVYYQYSYDRRGNLTEVTRSPHCGLDPQPNRQYEVVSTFVFDSANRMVRGTNEQGEQSHYIFNGLGHLVAQELIIERGAHGFGDIYAQASPQVDGVVAFARHESARPGRSIEIDDNGHTENRHTIIGHAETCRVSEHIADNLQHTLTGANDHSQCRRGEVCAHARVVTPEIDRDRFMVIHREFVLDYTTEMVNTLMEVERGENGLTFKYVYGALNEFGQQTRESVTITGTYTVNGRNGASVIRAVDETFFYHNNRLGSSEFLTSDVNGRIVSFVEYDQWGRPIGGDSLTLGNREIDLVTQFTGHRYDPVLGMYYARFRMYDADIRRFTATDPVVGTIMNPQTMVQYTYVLNNPVKYIDPWGLHATGGGGYYIDEWGDRWNWEGPFNWVLCQPDPPSSPSFNAILESVWEYFAGLSDEQIFDLVSSGFLESLGISISSEWLENMGSWQHADANEMRQVLAFGMAYSIYNAYRSNNNDTVFYQNSWLIAHTTTQLFGFGAYGRDPNLTAERRHHDTQRFIDEQVRIEQFMIEQYDDINYWNRRPDKPSERSPMATRSFLSDPYLARYLTLHERISVHDSMVQHGTVLGRVEADLAAMGRGDDRDMITRVWATYNASANYMTSGEMIGISMAGHAMGLAQNAGVFSYAINVFTRTAPTVTGNLTSAQGPAPLQMANRGSTGRTSANNLNEQLAMQQVRSNPMEGSTRVPVPMSDARWPASEGWVKMQNVIRLSDGTKITIHFVHNQELNLVDDFKFK